MKKTLLTVAASLLVGFCSRAQTTLVDSIQLNGVWRSYRLYIPPNFAAGRPLILNFHGLGSNALEQQFYSNFMPIADTAGFLMAYPQGLSVQGTTYWNAGVPPAPSSTDDVGFASALIDTLRRRYSTDPDRVFATGMSLGGYMSYYLSCNLSQKLAAIASVTGSMYGPVAAGCTPGHPMPVLQVHGTADGTVPYAGNSTGIAIDSLIALWVRKNGCTPVPAQTSIPNTNTSDNSTADRFVYSGGRSGATVEFFKVYGGDHTWPGAVSLPGVVTNQDFSASKEIWRFFRQYRLAPLLSVSNTAPQAAPQTGPNPTTDFLHWPAGPGRTAVLRDLTGRVLAQTATSPLDLRALPAGLYLLDCPTGTDTRSRVKVVKD